MIQGAVRLPESRRERWRCTRAGTLDAWLAPPRRRDAEWRAVHGSTVGDGARAYRSYVYENPSFLEYFRTATTAGRARTRQHRQPPGAAQEDDRHRDASRHSVAVLVDADALILAPGLEPRKRWSVHRSGVSSIACGRCTRAWPHFQSVMDLTAMVLAKTDARIAAAYERTLAPDHLKPLGANLRDRLQRAIRATLDVTGHRELLEENRVLQRIDSRAKPVCGPYQSGSDRGPAAPAQRRR
jgi:phosphoenolpyruvate carboxylase